MTDYHLDVATKDSSQEISPLVNRLYRVVRVDPMTCQIIDFFYGLSRTLLKNLMRRIFVTDLINLKFFLPKQVP